MAGFLHEGLLLHQIIKPDFVSLNRRRNNDGIPLDESLRLKWLHNDTKTLNRLCRREHNFRAFFINNKHALFARTEFKENFSFVK